MFPLVTHLSVFQIKNKIINATVLIIFMHKVLSISLTSLVDRFLEVSEVIGPKLGTRPKLTNYFKDSLGQFGL